jgi:flagellar biosynthetic protein FliQ
LSPFRPSGSIGASSSEREASFCLGREIPLRGGWTGAHIAGAGSGAGDRVMNADQAVGLMKQLLWSTFLISAPVLAAALIVGLAISVLQVATQLQEMTLSYVPKLFVAALVLAALGPWMIFQITEFATRMIRLIPSLG